jgi:hypothetical protein
MIKDKIKISQEINFNGMPTWVSVGASLTVDDNVLDCLKSLQKDITEYKELEEKKFNKSKKNTPNDISGEVQDALDAINSCESLDGLKVWWLKSKSNLILLTAYKAKEKEITNAE